MTRIVIGLILLLSCASRLLAVDSVVVFNEIHYHPATNEAMGEWVELHNQMAIDIDLSAWFLEGEVDYTFAEGTIIPGGGYLVVASDTTALRASTGFTNIVGSFSGRLNNADGILELRDRNERLMDRIEYRDRGKWPIAADGSGATLAKRKPNATSGEPENWTSSVVVDGTPGEHNFPIIRTPQRRTLVPFDALWRFEASGTDLGTSWRAPGFNDSTWSGRNNATLISYWPFDGNAAAARGTNGNLVGTVAPTTDRSGAAGGALSFTGTAQQYVSVPGGGGLNAASAGTVSMWVKWAGTQDGDCCGTFGAILARQANGQFSDNVLALNSANPASARVVWRQTAASPVLITGTTVVGTNWHHIAVTFATSGTTLYVDGVAQGTAVGGALNNNPATALTIGAWSGDGGGFSTASIDDVAIWDCPLSAAQVAELAAQTKAPLDFAAPESAVYYAGYGRLTSDDDLRQTQLPLGPTTYYFRAPFVFNDEPSATELNLDIAVDDGAVFYLNGAEIYRHNMPAGEVSYSTRASSAVGDATVQNNISVPITGLQRGTNLLAVEVHQAVPLDTGMIFAAGLNAVISPSSTVETRRLITLHDTWKFDASDVDRGAAWRAATYDDSSWSNGIAVIHAGNGMIDGVPPDRITNVTAVASTQYAPDGRLAVHAANGNGLVGDAHVNTPQGTMWLNNGTFVTPNDLNPVITFDLRAVHPIRFMKVWNYNEDLPNRPELLSRGISRADILVGITNGVFTPHITGQSFNKAPGTQTDFSQRIDLGGVDTRYVRFEKLTNFPGGDNSFVGLSEVQFFKDGELRRTMAPLGAVTYYFRKSFQFAGDPSLATLTLNAAVDDGAVFYLNGTEIYRLNMPAGAVTHTTFADRAVASATFTGPIVIPTQSLRPGSNVFAVEVHQTAAASDLDMIFGAELTARVAPRDPADFDPGNLVFNEITASTAAPFQIELINRGAEPVDLAGYVVRRTGPAADVEYTLLSGTVAPGQFLVLNQAALGFAAAPGDKLFLSQPGRLATADAVEVHERARARLPDGTGDWLTPSAVTLGATNTFSLQTDVVINEIMYHAPPTLEVPPVIGTNIFITLTNGWRYDESGSDLGTDWRRRDYNDALWPSGAALLYASTNTLPTPVNTPLNLGPTTYYFRSSFVYTGAPAVVSLSLRHLVDDGAVFYLNGNEVHRFNMALGAITYTNNATGPVLSATFRTPVNVAVSNLVIGTNVLAVEVHQAALAGDDVVFGAELSARVEAVPKFPYRESAEEWIELFNRSSNTVNLTGWRIDEGIDFRFASNTTIAPGSYLVIARDPAALQANFSGISVVGPYTNTLSHRGERIVLKDASDNPADVVHYFDDGRWPRGADGRGASLELRDPRADNSAGEAWAASDETGRSSWRTYSYGGIALASAVGPDGQWREFVMGLHEAGEVLLDDISVIETPSTTPVQMLRNSTFDAGTASWRIIGNHHGEVIDDPDQPGNKVLRLVATGTTEHMNNHAETTFVGTRDVVNNREYSISFRAKWVNGSPQLHTRLYFNRLPRTTLIDRPAIHGTPGARNTAFAPNIGPTYSGLQHDPPVPSPFVPVTISVRAADPDGVATVTLWSAVDGSSWSSLPMTLSSDREYTAQLPGRPFGTIMQFYVEAVDSFGATSTFPADGRNSRALYKVDDGLAATNGLHNMRLISLTRDTDELFRQINLMSNERIGCTVIYDEREVFYDAGLRLKGSEHSRVTAARLGFNVAFTSEQRFRGVHDTVAIDRSESTSFGQREMLIHQTFNHAGGVPTKYHDLIHVMAPRAAYTGSAELQLARFSDVFLDDQYENGSDGTVFEYEYVYQLTRTDTGAPEGNKVPAEDNVVGLAAIRNMGDDKENYRWTFLIKNNEDRDDFSGIMAFAKTMELTGATFTSQITNVIDIDQWLRGVGVNALSGAGDSYGGDGSQHNVQFYVRPSDKRVLYFPHDVDAFFDANRPIVPNSDVQKMIAVPAWGRIYYGHLLDILTTTYNANYMTRWANHFGRLLPAQNFNAHLSFLVQRANLFRTQINALVASNLAFTITSNGGTNFGTTSNTITLTGRAPLTVKRIEVNGVAYPINWTALSVWSMTVPLFAGPNELSVQGVDRGGRRITNAVDSIVITNDGSGAPLPVVINEWMADNDGPFGLADPMDGQYSDWFELFNPNTNAVNIGGFYLTDDLADPTKSLIPSGTIVPPLGFLLVWADNQPEQNASDTNGNLHVAFELRRAGELLAIVTPGGVAQHRVEFGGQSLNVSQGLFPDGSTNMYYMTNWTPRASNTLADALRIRDLAINAGVVTLTWGSVPGQTYRVHYKNELDDPQWIALGTAVVASSSTASITDAPSPQRHRFYRVIRVNAD